MTVWVDFSNRIGCIWRHLAGFSSAMFYRKRKMQIEKRQKIRKQIIEKIAGLKEDIKSFELLTKPIPPDSAIGRITRMEAINSKSINEAALNKSKLLLSKLEHALTMIDDPDFGLCRECEEPIPYARLIAIPETELCVQCAENNNL